MKIGLYSPYFHIMGGGERYFLAIAATLSIADEVVLFAPLRLKNEAKRMFNIDLSGVDFADGSIFEKGKFLDRAKKLSSFEIFFYMTDGSLFFPLSKKNFLIIQSPAHIPPKTIFNTIKLKRWRIICYSEFMQDIIKTKIRKTAHILSPPVDVHIFNPQDVRKEKIILTVGRFFEGLHNKKQKELVEIFKKYYKRYFNGWRLVIAGGLTQDDGKKLVREIVIESQGYPVEVVVNPSFRELLSLYHKSSIYWHAAGFGEDLENHPERAEHFGITTIEAMAAGLVPVVFAAGGQKDIVIHNRSGFLWRDKTQLIAETLNLINDEKLRLKFSKEAMKRAKDFSYERFYERLEKMVEK